MKLLLSDNQLHLRFAPLTLTRPLAELRCGLFTNTERWKHLLPGAQIGYQTESYLQGKYPSTAGIWINAQVIPDVQLAKAVSELKVGEKLYMNSVLLAQNGEGNYNTAYSDSNLIILENRWDLYLLNAAILKQDFTWFTKGQTSAELKESNRLIGPADQLFIEEGARIEGAILNTNEGPIYIGKNAEVMEGALLRGPLALCDGAVVKMGAKIYGATTIGPECRVGGEVSNSLFQGYSNKGHDGFLGNAVLGEWCNIGAGTNNSNLKNNYEEVKLWSYPRGSFERTGLQFCGLVLGDHSKCGINTMFNTGTVVGVSCNVFGAGFPRNFIPDFSWGGPQGLSEYTLDKALATAERVMDRRSLALTPAHRAILSEVHAKTADLRRGTTLA